MKSAGKARNNGLYRHIRTSKEIIRNLLNDFIKDMIDFNRSGAFFSRSRFSCSELIKQLPGICRSKTADRFAPLRESA